MASKSAQQRHIRKHTTACALAKTEYYGRRMPNITLREKLLREGVPLKYIQAYERYKANETLRRAAADAEGNAAGV